MPNLAPLLIILIIMPIIALILSSKSLLTCLLSLEALTLSFIIMTTLILMATKMEILPPMMILTLGACEASLGLALLVKLTRTHGSDNLKSLSITKC